MRSNRIGFPSKVLTLGGGAVLAASLVTGCSSGHSSAAASTTTTTTSSSAKTGGGGTSSAATALQQAFVSVVNQVRPQVVEISTTSDLGSGIVYDTKGDIVTNDHVVGSATTFSVKLADGETLPASLVGAYPPDDLAVVRVNGAKKLSPASFGDSSAMQIGDIVFAIGNPLGLASSVTEGIVSFNGREVGEGNGVVLPSTIQTSAPINPGNSGGALVDLEGQVVGIPTLAAIDQQTNSSAAPGIGFAIPSDTVKAIASQLIATGKVTKSGRAALGISGGDAINGAGSPVGVLVESVQKGGAADQAGIPVGVAITAVNGQQTPTLASLQDLLARLAPGQQAKVTYLDQNGASHTVTVTLGQLAG